MTKRRILVIGIAIAVGLTLLILVGYVADWTGFKYTEPQAGDERVRTLWHWMDLLLVPAILALGALWFNRQERKAEREIQEQRRQDDLDIQERRTQTEREIARDRQRENALQMYLDCMTELLLKENLRTSF